MKTKKVCFLVWMVAVSLPLLFVVSPVKADGTWSPVNNITGFTGGFSSIAYGNGTYVATRALVQNNTPSAGTYKFTGRIFTSPDLATWTQQGSDIVFTGSGSYGANGFPVFLLPGAMNQFIVSPYCSDTSGNNATSKILASSNGIDWSEKYSGNDAYVNVSNIFGTFYATHITRSFDVGSNTTTINYKIRTSTDSDTWTDRYTGTYSGSGSSFGTINFSVGRYDQGYFAVLNIQNTSTSPSTFASKVFISSDGITWTERYVGTGNISLVGLRNTLAVSQVMPVTAENQTIVKILTSTDEGNAWTERYNQSYTGSVGLSLASDNIGAFVGWMGINNSGQFTVKMLYSSDGVTWTTPYDQTFTGSGSVSGMGVGVISPYFGTRIAVNTTGPTQTLVKLLLSPTGSSWTESYSNTFSGTASFTPAYRNGSFLAWGYDGTNPAILKYSGPVTVWAAGMVRETISETPVSGATVSIVGQPSITTTTAADGSFTLTGITPGTPYTLEISKNGYWPDYHGTIPYTPPGSPDYTVNSHPLGALYLTPNSQAAGWGIASGKGIAACRLVDGTTPGTGNIKGATVTATGSPSGKTYTASYFDTPYVFTGSSTFPNGRAFFLNVDDGDTLTINASATGWTFLPQTFSAFAGGMATCLFEGGPTGATYPISGVVRDTLGNLPLAAATIRITDVNSGIEIARPKTNEGGYYLTRLPSTGNYTITASRPGYQIETYPAVVTLSDPCPNATVNITMHQAQTPLYAEFTGDGLYTLNGTSWNLLTRAHPSTTAVLGSALFGYFAGDGFYQWGRTGWTLITKDQPSAMLASSSALYADFPAWGLYTWNGAVWIKLTNAHPQDMIATSSTLFAYFTGDGFYARTGNGWTRLTTARPQSMVASGPILYAYFTGDGLYQWNGNWTRITRDQPSSMVASSSTFYADFAGWGLYSWNGSAWTGLTSSHPTRMAASGSYFYADFAGDGLYHWNGTAWTMLTKDHPTNMLASGSTLYADFPGWGAYAWNGTGWGNNLTTSHPATMLMDPGN